MNTNIQKQYDNFSDTYSTNTEYDKQSNDLFYQQFDIDLTHKKLLDIGCGDGTDLLTFANLGAVPYGLEPSSEFVKDAKMKNPHAIIKEGVAESIPFSDDMFDVVVSKWALQTCTDLEKVFSEISRVLKPGGYFIYLSKHPWMQWMEKNRDYGSNSNYYTQQIVTSYIYEGKITLKEPSHTIGEYFNKDFFKNFELINYEEGTDFPASEQINNNIYPTYFVIKARRK